MMITGFTAATVIMEGIFKDIIGIQGVKGIMVFTHEGELAFKYFVDPWQFEPETKDWWGLFIYTLDGIREAEMVFEYDRLYIRRAKEGYLFVLASNSAPTPMIRLNCEILLSADREGTGQKGLNRFFRELKR
ncbi:MAG: hypothetical protein DRH12_06840 [Deltaproteobacteria bacterium]|nr:MAG: hypothetical protein DRH12_06840 [Deltaproteobacteria bacterium]